jgi:transposase
MSKVIRIGLDTTKTVFQVHGVDASERPVVRRQLRRQDMMRFFAELPPAAIGLEACGASHYCGN